MQWPFCAEHSCYRLHGRPRRKGLLKGERAALAKQVITSTTLPITGGILDARTDAETAAMDVPIITTNTIAWVITYTKYRALASRARRGRMLRPAYSHPSQRAWRNQEATATVPRQAPAPPAPGPSRAPPPRRTAQKTCLRAATTTARRRPPAPPSAVLRLAPPHRRSAR